MNEPEQSFKRKAKEAWRAKLGRRKARRFNFDKMLSIFYETVKMENAPKEKLSAKNAHLLNVYLSEKAYSEAKEDYKAAQQNNG